MSDNAGLQLGFFRKLESVELRFAELESKLASEGIDGKEMTRLIKERGSILEIVEAFRGYKSLLSQHDQAKALLAEDDDDMRAMAKEELAQLVPAIEDAETQLRILTLPRDPNDDKNVLLEIRAGTGGEEAALFAYDLFRMYTKFADKQGWRIEILSITEAQAGGYKEVIGLVSGDKVYSKLKYESGTHRVQRVPDTEAQGRIHTSACTVAILPEEDEVTEIEINPKDLEITTTRSSGAGGQHVNTTDSAIRIVHIPSGIAVECQQERSQHKNKEKAMKVLRARLLENARREQREAQSADRKEQVGSGDRSERIRTYNFPQGRLTDHRINLTIYKLDVIMEGDIFEVTDALASYYQSEQLKNAMESQNAL
ncbi:MAG: peptide chain release factor 1 [Oligoflexales bacterium]